MPELPEVETMCRGIRSIEGLQVMGFTMCECRLKPISIQPEASVIAASLVGSKVHKVSRLGKRVLVWFSGNRVLVIEPRMTGIVMLEDPPNQTHLRLEFRLVRGDAQVGLTSKNPTLPMLGEQKLLFWDRRGLGTVSLMSAEELEQQLVQRLGPDALQMTPALYVENFGTSRREIKVALLDQKLVAGIGNIYAAEILFMAGVDPRSRCDRLTSKQWYRISEATHGILNQAILHEGSTLSDGTYRNAINGEGSYQQCHRVYDREGLACLRCESGTVHRIVQAQRSTFFCPTCQKKRGLHPSLSD